MIYTDIIATVDKLYPFTAGPSREPALKGIIDYIQQKKDKGIPVSLIFVCTHNSRRSQFAQVWAHLASRYYGIGANCFSGGTEVTAFNDKAVRSLERYGFRIEKEGEENPLYKIYFSDKDGPIEAFSKLYNDPPNPERNFAAVMTCSDADDNCPFIPGADIRIPLHYTDPKKSDGKANESNIYDERSLQIANEMLHIFSRIK
jgi:arsenate reductase